jgi:hypothetical protein
VVRAASGIFDGTTDEAGLGRHANRCRCRFGCICKAVFEITRERYIDGWRDGADVRQCFLASDASVQASERPSAGTARSGDGRKPEAGQDACRPGIPRVGNHENTAGLVQRTKHLSLVGLRYGHGDLLSAESAKNSAASCSSARGFRLRLQLP